MEDDAELDEKAQHKSQHNWYNLKKGRILNDVKVDKEEEKNSYKDKDVDDLADGVIGHYIWFVIVII